MIGLVTTDGNRGLVGRSVEDIAGVTRPTAMLRMQEEMTSTVIPMVRRP